MRKHFVALVALLFVVGMFGCESTPRENQFTQAVETSGARGVLQPQHRVERLPWTSPYGEPFAWRKRVGLLPWTDQDSRSAYDHARAGVPAPYAQENK